VGAFDSKGHTLVLASVEMVETRVARTFYNPTLSPVSFKLLLGLKIPHKEQGSLFHEDLTAIACYSCPDSCLILMFMHRCESSVYRNKDLFVAFRSSHINIVYILHADCALAIKQQVVSVQLRKRNSPTSP
jgi:hypothetical protein